MSRDKLFSSATCCTFDDKECYGSSPLSVRERLLELGLLISHSQNQEELNISPQLQRKLQLLLDVNYRGPDDNHELLTRISAVFSRLLLELIQAHYSTKQREQDFQRLVKAKKISIRYPKLIDDTIDLVLRLYNAAGQYAGTSYERGVLVRFIFKELESSNCDRRQVERIVQTLYWSGCFNIIKMEGQSSHMKLRDELVTKSDIRQNLDKELIKLAHSNHIRLPPESWAFILYGLAGPDNVSRVQSLLDRLQAPVTVEELEETLRKVGDKYGISFLSVELQHVQNHINHVKVSSTVETGVIIDLLDSLLRLKHLFSIRQKRSRVFD